jgi:Tfp pilus assembly protein PilE
MRRNGHTLVELVLVVFILGALACLAVPRFSWGAVMGAQADAAVAQLTTDLRRTRNHAIWNAQRNPLGFALIMTGDAPHTSYEITDLHDASVVAVRAFPAGVRCTRGRRCAFGPLGNLQEGSDTRLQLGTADRTYNLQIVPATGMVKWLRPPK